MEPQALAPELRGCRYLATQIELKAQSRPASQVARRIKGGLTAFPCRGNEVGANDPGLLARQLILVFDGASARAGIGTDNLTGSSGPLRRRHAGQSPR